MMSYDLIPAMEQTKHLLILPELPQSLNTAGSSLGNALHELQLEICLATPHL